VDFASFRNRRPEFATTSNVVVQAALNDAAAQMNQIVWGELYDEAHMWLAAHLIALGPSGHDARNEANPSTGTTYKTQYDDLIPKAVSCYGTVP